MVARLQPAPEKALKRTLSGQLLSEEWSGEPVQTAVCDLTSMQAHLLGKSSDTRAVTSLVTSKFMDGPLTQGSVCPVGECFYYDTFLIVS